MKKTGTRGAGAVAYSADKLYLKERFLRRFGLKMGEDFVYFDLESGMVFEKTTGAYERIYHFNSK